MSASKTFGQKKKLEKRDEFDAEFCKQIQFFKTYVVWAGVLWGNEINKWRTRPEKEVCYKNPHSATSESAFSAPNGHVRLLLLLQSTRA